jgi:hypothetical protein
VGLFKDVIAPCNNPGCCFFYSQANGSCKKKSNTKTVMTHTNVRKRLRLTAPGEHQEKENKGPVITAETPSTSSIPVKSFYKKSNNSIARSPSPVSHGKVSPLPSLLPVGELNESESPQTNRDRQPIWTRSRPYIFSDSTITYSPYDIGFDSSFFFH